MDNSKLEATFDANFPIRKLLSRVRGLTDVRGGAVSLGHTTRCHPLKRAALRNLPLAKTQRTTVRVLPIEDILSDVKIGVSWSVYLGRMPALEI